ncbi:MAG: tetratricopeptide repeat protein [Candidatus Krumholzibacteriota bacterium]|nr:tetratricopeptide repeat protein [Candidatus Krumholzibacteriota bacterium]
MNGKINICIVILMVFLAISACSSGEKSTLYRAEKELFEARKLNRELKPGSTSNEFIEKAVGSYRSIVDRYSSGAGSVEGMEMIVVSAQIELAELEFRAGDLENSIADFQKAYLLADNIPEAKANALWSAAFISEQNGDASEAIRLFEKFSEEYLGRNTIEKTSRMNTRYLLVPVRLSNLYNFLGRQEEGSAALGKGEQSYRAILSKAKDPVLVRETQYNLVTVLLEQKKWGDALALVREMENLYRNEKDRPALMFLEAKIEMEGFDRQEKASAIFTSIVDEFPDAQETVPALLMIAGIHQGSGRYKEAEEVYNRIIRDHKSSGSGVVEATWQLANISEIQGRWIDASLHFKSIYTSFPTTLQGMESPLRIAAHFEDNGEKDAADNAYERALEHYETLLSRENPLGIRIMAEEYAVRILSLQKKWKEAAERLTTLPDKYPEYGRFAQNYLTAASIYEKELGDREKAIETLQACVERYEGSDLAVEAQRHLERIREEQ